MMNACDEILQAGLARPDEPALIAYASDAGLVAEPRVFTHAALRCLVGQAAAVIAATGVRPGERVAILMDDGAHWCAAFLGAIQLGAVPMAINTRLSTEHYAFIAADSAATLWLVEDALIDRVGEAARSAGARVIVANDFEGACVRASEQTTSLPCAPSDPAFWLYSSGTTGPPKGIVHSHASCAASGHLLRDVVGIAAGDLVFSTSKLFFAFALDNALLGALSLGATTILNAAWAEPERALEQAARHRPRLFMSVPSFFRRLLAMDRERLEPFRSVAFFYTGGERVPDAVANDWLAVSGRPLAGCYGMSETYCNAIANYPGRERLGSCGELLPGVRAVLREAGGAPAAAGEPGVLWLQHPTIALRYHRDEFTARAFEGEWFCTNDLFTTDAEGHFWHQGRADELLKVAGQWVKPGEVEEAALAGGLASEAACVVVPDQDGFDRLALFIVPARELDPHAVDLPARIHAALSDRLPRHSLPRWIRVVDELPRTPTGKVQRFRLRERLLGEATAGANRR